MEIGVAEEVSSGPTDLQALVQAQNENFEHPARTLQSGMESLASGLATKFTDIFKVIEEQSLDKASYHDRGNDSVEVEGLPGGKGPINPRKTRKRRFEYADEGSDSSDPGGDWVPCKRNRKEAFTSQTRDTNNDPTGTRVEDDCLSLEGHDSLDDDINNLVDPQQNRPDDEPEDDVLDEMSIQHVTAEKIGKSINSKVAGIVNSLFANKQKDDKVNKIVDKQARPENCPNLFVKSCNEEIWRAIMTIDDRKKDKQMQKC
eukprot:gene21325-23400_t